MDDFLLRALIAGIAIALTGGALGSFLVWRRMAFFGDTLAHGSLLGVALGLFLGIDLTVGALILCLLVALILCVELIRHAGHSGHAAPAKPQLGVDDGQQGDQYERKYTISHSFRSKRSLIPFPYQSDMLLLCLAVLQHCLRLRA